MLDLIWDLTQQRDISVAQSDASDARQRANEGIRRSDDLGERVERLALLCQSMWELLSERAGVTKHELVEKVLEVDARDGHQDGRMRQRVLECPKCKSKVASRRPKCIICGTVVATKHPFDV
jgi:hypothetical protein